MSKSHTEVHDETGSRPHHRPRSRAMTSWLRLLCTLRWHTWTWYYNEDRSDRWRGCEFCGRERASGGNPPPVL